MEETEEDGTPIGPIKAYMKAVGSKKKGKTYGLGSADKLYYNKGCNTDSSGDESCFFGGGYYTQLEARNQQLEADMKLQKQEAEAQKKEFEDYKSEQARINAERDAWMAKVERMMMRGSNCEQMFTPTPRDPRDPSGDGGSGANSTLPVR